MTPSLSSTRFFLALCLVLATGVQCFVPPSSSTSWKKPHSQLQVVSMETLETVEALQASSAVVVPTAAAVAVPATTWLARMDAFWQTSPYTAAALVCGFKASAADAIAQHRVDLDDLMDLDLKRNLAFVLYGALYQGMVHEYVFNHLYPAWFGTGTELGVVMVKVVFNLFVQTTFVTLPVAYLLKAVVMEEDGGYVVQVALDKYWQDIRHQQLLTKCFGLWGPVQCLTFSVVPEHYRVTFIAVVSFFWLIILSQISSTENVDIEAGVEE